MTPSTRWRHAWVACDRLGEALEAHDMGAAIAALKVITEHLEAIAGDED